MSRVRRGLTDPDRIATVYRHAIRRAKERYGIDLTQEDLAAMTLAIQNDRARFLRAASPGSHWILTHKGTTYRVAYHGIDKLVVTILPRYPDSYKGPRETA